MTQPPFESGPDFGAPDDEPELVIASLRQQLELARQQLAETEQKLAISEEVATAAGEEIAYLEERNQIDPLMGIGNRARLESAYNRLITRPRRPGTNNSVIMVDVDRFKAVNDTYGHSVGDMVLRQVAERIRDGVRDEDVPGRYGGEEIAVLLPDTDTEEAWHVAERLRTSIEEAPYGEQNLRVTASFGIGPLVVGEDISAGVSFADQALYAAKATGRNRIMLYSDLNPEA